MSGSDPRRPSELVPVMTWLAVKGMATRAEVIERWGERDPSEKLLDDLISEGSVTEEQGYVYLSERGNDVLSEICRQSLSESEQREFGEFCEAFAAIDRDLKRIATEWQSLRGARADLDDEKVMGVVAEWMALNDRLCGLVEESPAVVGEVLRPYTPALTSALTRFLEGELSAFTGADDTTYHSTWFVMHELILRTAGQSR